MTKKDFFDAMNGIDPALIERADKVKLKKKNNFVKIAAIAAAFALLVGAVAAVLPALIDDGITDDGPGTRPTTQMTSDSITWSDIFALQGGNKIEIGETAAEQKAFSDILNEEYSAYRKSYVIEADRIGEKLADTDMRTGWRWENAYDGKEEDIVIAKAEIFAIKDVATNAAVAVRYLDGEDPTGDSTGYYYVAVNSKYHFESLEKFFEDFDFAGGIELKGDCIAYLRSGYFFFTSERYRLNENGGELAAELLTGLEAEATVCGWYDAVNDDLLEGSTAYLRLTASVDTVGKSAAIFYVLDNGYMVLKITDMDEVAIFNVGRDSTDAIFKAVKDNGELIKGSENFEGLVEATTKTCE